MTPRSPIFLFINDKHTSGADPEMSSGLDSPFHCCNFSYMTFEIKTILCHKSVKSTKVRVTTWVFFKLKMHQNPFSARAPPWNPCGAYDAPQTASRLGTRWMHHMAPFPSTSLASRSRRLRRLASQISTPSASASHSPRLRRIASHLIWTPIS